MTVSLTPELEKFINGKIESGQYSSASEVVREARRLLQDQLERLRRDIQVGLDQLDRRESYLVWKTLSSDFSGEAESVVRTCLSTMTLLRISAQAFSALE